MLDETEAVTIVSTVTTPDDMGDSTTTETREDIPGVLFAPSQIVERGSRGNMSAGTTQPGVMIPATFYLPVARQLNSDDVILHDGLAWRVLGGSAVWGDQTEVPVERTDAF